MNRIYTSLIKWHFDKYHQMVFLVGPRQAGKTTVSMAVKDLSSRFAYLNWDNVDHRKIMLGGVAVTADFAGLNKLAKDKPIIVFDEIHKYGKWKNFLKGFYDMHKDNSRIIVTGSSRLDIYKKGGDSLMGRYFSYRMHQLSLAELSRTAVTENDINAPLEKGGDGFAKLVKNGGFPEPFIKNDSRFLNRWKSLRHEQLVKEDIRDLSRVQELGQIELLAVLLRHQAGHLTNYSSLANKINVSSETVKRWIKILQSFFYCFSLHPWSSNVPRALIKEPKIYLWDWSNVDDEGGRLENMVASHLLKAVHYWTDSGLGEYGLWFVRDKEKRETDFLVTRNKQPWFLVEAKSSAKAGLSKNLFYFQEKLKAKHAFQVAFDMEYVDEDCFKRLLPTIVPAETFLSQLV